MHNHRLTITSLLFAIIIIQTTVPGLGYLTLGPLSLTIIPVTVMIASIVVDTKQGMFVGLFWGLIVFLRAFFLPTSPLSLVFTNPLIAILPRILIGLVIGKLFSLCVKNDVRNWKLAFLGALGSLINTVVFLGLVLLFFDYNSATINQMSGKALVPFLLATFFTNGIPEMIMDAVLLPLISKPLLKKFRK